MTKRAWLYRPILPRISVTVPPRNQAFPLRTGLVIAARISIGIKLPRQQLLNPIDGMIGDPGQPVRKFGSKPSIEWIL